MATESLPRLGLSNEMVWLPRLVAVDAQGSAPGAEKTCCQITVWWPFTEAVK